MIASGDPTSGSSKTRGAVDDPKTPLMSADQAAQMQGIGRALDEAQKQLRDGKVDPKLLTTLGMTQAQFKTFVEDYSQKYGQIKPQVDRTARATDVAQGGQIVGTDQLQQGRGTSGQSTGSEKLDSDQTRKLYESKSASIPTEYKKEVEDFFRAISEGSPTATPAPTSRPAK